MGSDVGNWFAYTEHAGNRQGIILVTYAEMQANDLHQPTEYILAETGTKADPAQSPDAHWPAFMIAREGPSQIYLMPTTRRPQVNLTDSPGVNCSPDWLPLPAGE